jgi:hypothetical protein
MTCLKKQIRQPWRVKIIKTGIGIVERVGLLSLVKGNSLFVFLHFMSFLAGRAV